MTSFAMISTLFGGLGIFFIGIKMISSHLSQMAGRGLRIGVLRLVDKRWSASLLGAIFGAVTQSTNAVTFIVTSMVTANLVQVRAVMPVVIWANLGTGVLVFLSTLSIRPFILSLLGLIGIAYFLNVEKSPRYRHTAAALLGVALLFLGLDLVKEAASPMQELELVGRLLANAREQYWLVFFLGLALALIAQSSATVTVVTVLMSKVGLLNLDLTLMMIYGAGIGSAASLAYMTLTLSGLARQLAYLQIFQKAGSAVLMVVLLGIERGFDIPLVESLIRLITSDTSLQGCWAYVLMQLLGCVLVSLMSEKLHAIAVSLAPATIAESRSKPHFLYARALDDPQTALDLVTKEQLRQFAYLNGYLATDDAALIDSPESRRAQKDVHGANLKVTAEIDEFLAELLHRVSDREVMDRILNFRARNRLLADLQQSIHELDGLLRPLRDIDSAATLARSIIESLDFIILALLDAVTTGDRQDCDLFMQMTADNSGVMEHVRQDFLARGNEFSPQLHEQLFSATSLFERINWLLRQYCGLLSGSLIPGQAAGSE
jgi:phosphate:Na+ symporter